VLLEEADKQTPPVKTSPEFKQLQTFWLKCNKKLQIETTSGPV